MNTSARFAPILNRDITESSVKFETGLIGELRDLRMQSDQLKHGLLVSRQTTQLVHLLLDESLLDGRPRSGVQLGKCSIDVSERDVRDFFLVESVVERVQSSMGVFETRCT